MLARRRLVWIPALSVALEAAALGAGCSSSHTGGEDAGIVVMLDGGGTRLPDGATVLPDGATMPADGAMMMGPVCGNGRVEAMEECDDGDTEPGDGCDANCDREPYCGDGVVTAPEVCDDENNRSGDGCRSDCRSNETCGNGVVDYAVGEICDGSEGCGSDCRAVEGCGDGTTSGREECDDGNTTWWDGCGADCRDEVTLHVDELQFGDRTEGCDYSGDGMPDNQFARALGPAGPLLNMFLSGGAGGGVPDFLMAMLGLDDPRGQDDPEVRVGWMMGERGPTAGTYLVDPGTLGPDGMPATSLQGAIAARRLAAGPEDIDLPIAFLPLTLYQGRVQGLTSASGGRLSSVGDGLLCGVIPPTLLTIVTADLLEMLGGMGGGFMIEVGDPCDGSVQSPNLADMLIGGFEVFGLRIGRVAPDVDLDGDGLETFEVTREGPKGCQPVVTACIDGDGTRIEGRDCLNDPRINDGYSAGLTFTASRAEVVGVAGSAPPPGP